MLNILGNMNNFLNPEKFSNIWFFLKFHIFLKNTDKIWSETFFKIHKHLLETWNFYTNTNTFELVENLVKWEHVLKIQIFFRKCVFLTRTLFWICEDFTKTIIIAEFGFFFKMQFCWKLKQFRKTQTFFKKWGKNSSFMKFKVFSI